MAKMRKTWQEKLEDSKDLPKVVEITGKMFFSNTIARRSM